MNPEDMMDDPYQGGLGAQAAAVQSNPYSQSPEMPDPTGGGAPGREELLQEVIRLLMQGVDPDEIVSQGVPYDVVEEAMRQVMNQAGDAGLAPEMAAVPPQGEVPGYF